MATLDELFTEYEEAALERERAERAKEEVAWNALSQEERDRIIKARNEESERFARMIEIGDDYDEGEEE